MSPRPPAWARRLLRWAAPPERADDVIGDLEEAHASRRSRRGPLSAWVLTSLEAADVALALVRCRFVGAGPRLPGRLSWPEVAGAFRALRAQPVLAFAATLALATGLGIATAGFAFVDSLLWGRLPWPGGDRFVLVSAYQEPELDVVPLDAETFLGMRRESGMFEHVGLIDGVGRNLEHASGDLEPVEVERASPALFQAIPVQPLAGRLLGPADAAVGAAPVILLRESLWRRRFGGDPEVVGRTLRLSGAAYTVVGVLPDAYRSPASAEAWLPFPDPGPATLVDGRAFAVLRPGASRETARARVEAMAGAAPRSGAVRVRMETLPEALVGPFRPVLMAMVGFVVLVLLVVAANVANLFYARAIARSGELAVRTALGASRARLVSQLGVEAFVVAAAAAAAGLAAAQLALRPAKAIHQQIPWLDFSLDASKVAFLVAATLLSGLVAGVWPAVRATRRDPAVGLRQRSRGAAHGLGRAGAAMIVAQMAVSVALVGISSVFARGFAAYAHPRVALPRGEVMSAWVDGRGHPPAQAFVDALADIPGVAVATATTALPRQEPETVRIEPEEPAGPGAADGGAPRRATRERASLVEILPGFFDAMGAAPTAGRGLAPADMEKGAAPVAVVNEPFVRDVLGGGNAVGRRILVDGARREIVGVVPDLGITLGDPTRTAGLYVPLSRDVYQLVVRARDPLPLAGKFRAAAASVDPTLQLGTLLPLERIAEDNMAFMRVVSLLFLGVGAVAMLLSLVTLYALTSYAVARRTREIGIRVALGEGPVSVVRTVVGGTAMHLALGGALGSGLGWLLLRGESLFTFGLPPAGPWTFPLVSLAFALAAAGACWAPTGRALAIQPMEALRQE